MDETKDERYYAILIEVWKQMDTSSWVGFNILIAIEGVLVAAFVAGVTAKELSYLSRSALGLIIAIIGIFLGFAGLLILTRRQKAMRMIAHQGRRMEDAIFRQAMKDKCATHYFPMFFHGNRALFLNVQNSNHKLTDEEVEIRKLVYHDPAELIKDEGPIKWHETFSESDIEAKYVPLGFIFLWGLLASWALWLLPGQSTDLNSFLGGNVFQSQVILAGSFWIVIECVFFYLIVKGKKRANALKDP